MKEYKTVKISSKRQITIPSSFNILSEGDSALLVIENDKIEIRPIIDEEVNISALLSEKSLAEDWLSEEDEKAFEYLQKL